SRPLERRHPARSGRLEARRPRQAGKPIILMKTPLEAPEKQIAEETSAQPEKPVAETSVIDTSKMSEGKRAALELAEASRDPLDERGSFASNLFIGRYDFDRIFPYPAQSAEDRAKGDPF